MRADIGSQADCRRGMKRMPPIPRGRRAYQRGAVQESPYPLPLEFNEKFTMLRFGNPVFGADAIGQQQLVSGGKDLL